MRRDEYREVLSRLDILEHDVSGVKAGGKPMIAVQLKRQITSLLDALPEPKLAVVFDLVQFLTERDLQAAWMSAQSQSAAYQEWVGSDNDVYDEVFADAWPAR